MSIKVVEIDPDVDDAECGRLQKLVECASRVLVPIMSVGPEIPG